MEATKSPKRKQEEEEGLPHIHQWQARFESIYEEAAKQDKNTQDSATAIFKVLAEYKTHCLANSHNTAGMLPNEIKYCRAANAHNAACKRIEINCLETRQSYKLFHEVLVPMLCGQFNAGPPPVQHSLRK